MGLEGDRNPQQQGPKTVWVKARPDAHEPIAPHEGRHSAASYLIEAGLNDLELTATIGHSDSRTTKRIYGHLFPDSSATIAAKLDAYHAATSRRSVFTDCLPTAPLKTRKPRDFRGIRKYRYGDSNPGFRRERAAS